MHDTRGKLFSAFKKKESSYQKQLNDFGLINKLHFLKKERGTWCPFKLRMGELEIIFDIFDVQGYYSKSFKIDKMRELKFGMMSFVIDI